MFLNVLAERHHTSTWVKEWYDKKCKTTPDLMKNSAADKKQIAAYKKLIDMEDKNFNYVDETGRNRSIDEAIMCQAARSNYIPELLAKLKDILSAEQISSLQDVLYYFEPIYQDIVWKPRSAVFQKQVEEFRKQTIDTKMCQRLTEVKHFLNSPWSSDTPFLIALAPLPFNGKGTHGQSIGIVQTVELRPSDKFQKSADVVFHEACHALWFAKRDQEDMVKLFAIPGRGALPLTELYEGMATALGQGWYPKQAFGRTEPSWYADAIINRYSHVVFPLYEDYLKRNRVMDAQFAKEATAVYYRMYPEADKQINLTSSYLILADEMKEFPEFRASVYKAMPRLRECTINTPPDAKESVESFAKSHAERAAILTAPSKLEQLRTLGLGQPEIDKLKNIPNGWTTITFGGKKVLFCLAETSEEQKKIFAEVLKLSKWPGL